MARMMIRAGGLLVLALLHAVPLAIASEPTAEAPRISVGSVMTPQAATDTVPTTVEPPVPPSY